MYWFGQVFEFLLGSEQFNFITRCRFNFFEGFLTEQILQTAVTGGIVIGFYLRKDSRAAIGRIYIQNDAFACGQPDSRSEEHTSELQSLMRISYAVSCLKQKKYNTKKPNSYI